MFWHNFKYTLKILFKNKALIFWTFAFPLFLGTFFKMAFSNIESSEKLNIIDIAIVNNDTFNNNEIYKEVFKTLGDKENKERLFNINYVDEKKAKEQLENNEITGYITFASSPILTVASSGINETIIKSVIEEIIEQEKIITDICEKQIKDEIDKALKNNEIPDINTITTKVYSNIDSILEENPNIKNISNNNLGYVVIEFYTLIAMVCLYSGTIGMTAINNLLANMSNRGKRVSVSGSSKSTLILSSTLASYLVEIIGVMLLFIFTIFVLKVDYGNLPLVIILTLVGSLAGLSLGIAVSCLLKVNENAKIGIIIAISMVCCFLSGMMGITMKYVIDKNVPIINKINPGNMITDGLYSLYYYGTYNRYIFNIISLIIFSLLMLLISSRSLRRQQYDSI